MKLAPDAEQRAFRDHLHRALARRPADPGGQWQALVQLGLTGIGIPETLGGSGGGDDEIAIAAYQLALAGWRTPFTATVAHAIPVLAHLPAPAVAAPLRAIAAGTLRVAVVCDPATDDSAPVRVEESPQGLRLTGAAPLVRNGAEADAWLIDARNADGEKMLLWTAADTPGVRVRPVSTVDGHAAADLWFDDACLPPAACLARGERAAAALDHGLAARQLSLLWGAVASIEELVRLLIDHLRTRHQFGQPLAAFQAIQHRAARLAVLAAEARAAALYAQAEHRAAPRRRDRAAASARLRVADIASHVAAETIQLSGAIGFTEESPVAAHVKALFAFRHDGPDRFRLEQRLATLLRTPGEAGRPLAGGPGAAPDAGCSLALHPDDTAFFHKAGRFVASAVDDGLARGARLTIGVFPEPDIAARWHHKLYAQGWVAPYLPPAAGGTGWTALQAYLFEHACAAGGAPSLQLQGLRMLAPVLLQYGTPAQIENFLPAILAGTALWCQGYSEPGAGSDLASLRTRAERHGDQYIVNGAKIWTTQAQHATHMFALVRTATGAKRQEGISFLLIDMQSPGITVRPIRTLAGEEEFNEVFFDNVQVPGTGLIGKEGEGWEIAKYLLDHERGGSTVSGPLRALLARAVALACDDRRLDPLVASAGAALDAIEMGELAEIADPGWGLPLSVRASARKLRMAEVRQQIGALAATALGRDALRWPVERPLHHQPELPADAEVRLAVVPGHFNDYSYSIFAGSSEIQLSLIARALGIHGPPARSRN